MIRDIDFVKDDAFYNPDTYPSFKREVCGNIKKGSIGTRTFKKGIVIYVSFSMALPEKDVEYINGKD